jgi:leucine dehydrogenase
MTNIQCLRRNSSFNICGCIGFTYLPFEILKGGRIMVFDKIQDYSFEQISFCHDKETGLKAIIVIHDTTLGPAAGGSRLMDYSSEEEALIDGLRLARGMSRKNSLSGANLGGAKAVIIAKPEQKTEAMLGAYGKFVAKMNGRFITGQDAGLGVEDAKIIAQESNYVMGVKDTYGEPSRVTAHGVMSGIRACAKDVFGSSRLAGRKVAIQGVGAVGYFLARELHEDGAKLIVTDISDAALQKIAEELPVTVVPMDEIYGVECDIFSPCALGAVINDETISRFKCKVIAGAANNQLMEYRHGDELHKKGILYAPDYAINAGGVYYVMAEMNQIEVATTSGLMEAVEGIGATTRRIVEASKRTGEPTHKIADSLADERIRNKRHIEA